MFVSCGEEHHSIDEENVRSSSYVAENELPHALGSKCDWLGVEARRKQERELMDQTEKWQICQELVDHAKAVTSTRSNW